MAWTIDEPKRRGERLEWEDLDFSSFPSRPLDAAALRWLRDMHDVEDHTICRALLSRIMRQEGRHIDFYASQALRRLEGRPRAALSRWWRPVGSGVMPANKTRWLMAYLPGAANAVIRRIDRNVAGLAGLSGLCLLEEALCRLEPLSGDAAA